MKVKLTDLSGIAVISDFEHRLDLDPLEEADFRSVLPTEARNGRLFYIDGEDPIEFRLELVTAFPNEPGYDLRFTPTGGNYLLNLPSGRIAVSGLKDWATPNNGVYEFSVEPGTYAINAYWSGEHDSDRYKEDMTRLVGKEEWRYREKVDTLALLGCFPTLAALGVAVFASVTYGLYVLALAALCWLPHVIGRFTRRYKAVDRITSKYESDLPLYVLVLSPVQDSTGLVGGCLRV